MIKGENYELKENEVFFLHASFGSWTIRDEHVSFTSEIKGLSVPDDMLLAVKYLGGGIVEEMITGEKFIITKDLYNGDGVYSQLDTYYVKYDDEILDGVRKGSVDISLNKENLIDQSTFIKKQNHIKKIMSNYPLIISSVRLFYVNDYYKEKYVKHSNEERKEVVSIAKSLAQNSVNNVIERLDEMVKKNVPSQVSNEELEEAYKLNAIYDLDNDLSNFAHKGKSR